MAHKEKKKKEERLGIFIQWGSFDFSFHHNANEAEIKKEAWSSYGGG